MDNNTINSIGCTGTGEEGSNGLSGGLEVITTSTGATEGVFLPSAPVAAVPEPGTFLLFGFGLAGLFVFRTKFFAVA